MTGAPVSAHLVTLPLLVDRLVAEAVARLEPQVDVRMLAQPSMLRSMPAILAAGCRIAVLSSPASAIEEVAKILG